MLRGATVCSAAVIEPEVPVNTDAKHGATLVDGAPAHGDH